jgi:hypothetical protein
MKTALQTANAYFNLVNIGFEPEVAVSHAARWTMKHCTEDLTSKLVQSKAGLVDASSFRELRSKVKVFCPIHFGNYPKFCIQLAKELEHATIVVVIGSQPSTHQVRLVEEAQTLGIKVDFISGDRQIIRKSRQAIADGKPIIIMIDVPWSKSTEANLVPIGDCGFGKMLGISTLERLVKSLDLEFQFCLPDFTGKDEIWIPHKLEEFKMIYPLIGRLIMRSPEHFERLSSFHNYFSFNTGNDAMAIIRLDDKLILFGRGKPAFWSLEVPKEFLADHASPKLISNKFLMKAVLESTGREPSSILYI